MTPSVLANTRSPGRTTARADPHRRVDGRQRHLLQERGIVSLIKAVEIWNLTVLFLVAYASVKNEPGVGVGGDAVAQVRANQRSINDLAHTIGYVNIADLQLVDRPAIIVADASLGFAFGGDRFRHVSAQRHVLRGERPARKGLLNVQRLPVTLELVFGSPLRAGNPICPQSKHRGLA